MFRYDPALLERFPTIRAGVLAATGIANQPSPPGLVAAYQSEQQRTLARIGDSSLAELPSIAAWRRAFAGFGTKPTQYRNAAEALLRRLTKKGDIPSISVLVDIGNLVSIRYALPVAFFDQRDVSGGTTVRFADGTESFTDLGATAPVHPEPGEVVFVDDAGLVSARRWCWRQSAQSATGPETQAALITVEGHHDTAASDVAAATADLIELLGEYQPQAAVRSVQLSPESPAVLWD